MSREFKTDISGIHFEEAGIYFAQRMRCLCGRTATISSIPSRNRFRLVDWDIEPDTLNWSYCAEMFEPVRNIEFLSSEWETIINV
jgi:hypothetical protein